MKIKLLFLLSIYLFVNNCFGQITFQRVISSVHACSANAVQQTTDGSYIMTGNIDLKEVANSAVYLVKTDATGDTLWTRTFGGDTSGVGSSVQQTKDGGYIIAGYIIDSVSNTNLYLVKTNAGGDTAWTKVYAGGSGTNGYFIQQTSDSGYIVTGNTKFFGVNDDKVYLLKLNALGDTLWTKTYGGANSEWGSSVRQTSDSGYIIAGITRSFGAGSADVYLIKTKANGDTLWTKTYGGTNYDFANCVRQTSDSGYIIAGTTASFSVGTSNIYLIKTKANGDTLWTKMYSGTLTDEAYDVQQTTDSGYIITGFTTSFGNYNGAVYLIKTNADGDTLWTKTYGRIEGALGYSVTQTTDGGYAIAGVTYSFVSSTSASGIYLIKTDANGNSNCYEGNAHPIVSSTATQVGSTNTIIGSGGIAIAVNTVVGSSGADSILCLVTGIHEQSINNSISIYPNPAGNQLTIDNSQLTIKKAKISILNTLGQTVLQLTINNNQSSIDVSSLSSGIYFVRIADEKESWVGKFVQRIKYRSMLFSCKLQSYKMNRINHPVFLSIKTLVFY